jgi:nicotinamidase-related amidase
VGLVNGATAHRRDAVAVAVKDVLDRARSAEAVVVHVRNNGAQGDPDAPGVPGWELVHEVRDGEHIVDKSKPDAFADTALAELIPASGVVVVAGMQSEYCGRTGRRRSSDPARC